MQQLAPTALVCDLVAQANGLKQVKYIGSTATYPCIPDMDSHSLSLRVLSDSGRNSDREQLCSVAGLLVDGYCKRSLFHILDWSSHRAKHPVQFIGAAEILAAGEAIYVEKLLAKTLFAVFGIKIPLLMAVDSNDWFSSLSPQRNFIYESIRADVNVIRH